MILRGTNVSFLLVLIVQGVGRVIPKPSRSMHFGDVSETKTSLGQRYVKRIDRAE